MRGVGSCISDNCRVVWSWFLKWSHQISEQRPQDWQLRARQKKKFSSSQCCQIFIWSKLNSTFCDWLGLVFGSWSNYQKFVWGTSCQFDQREAGAAESKSHWRQVRKNFWSGSLASKYTLEDKYFIDSEPKGEVNSSKIDQLAAIYTSRLKWGDLHE